MALDKDMELLARVAILSGLDRDALRLLAFAAEPRRSRAGEVLFHQGQPAEGASLIVTGAVALSTAAPGRADERLVGPGTLLDEQALLSVSRHTATATARDAVSVLHISRSAFLRALGEHPTNAAAIRRYWAAKLNAKVAAVKRGFPP